MNWYQDLSEWHFIKARPHCNRALFYRLHTHRSSFFDPPCKRMLVWRMWVKWAPPRWYHQAKWRLRSISCPVFNSDSRYQLLEQQNLHFLCGVNMWKLLGRGIVIREENAPQGHAMFEIAYYCNTHISFAECSISQWHTTNLEALSQTMRQGPTHMLSRHMQFESWCLKEKIKIKIVNILYLFQFDTACSV